MKLNDILSKQAAAQPDSIAISDTTGLVWSFAALNNAAKALAVELQQAGVQPGDRVMVLVENCAPAIAAVFACGHIGAAVIPINARQTMAEINRVIDHATPAAILAATSVSADAQSHAAQLGSQTISGIFGTLELTLRESTPDPTMHDVAVVLYTTGTTGIPKGVMLTHSNVIFGGTVSANIRGITRHDLVYGVLPISHVFGLTSVLVACVLSGAHIQLVPRFDPARLYHALNSGITVLAAVPQMLAKLMHYTETQGHTTLPSSSLRFVSAGAAPLDLDWKRRTEAFFALPVQNGYGMTETSAGICVTTHRESNSDISVGQPLPGVEVILDTTVTGSDGETGEIIVRGGNVMKGYYRHPEATAEVLSPDGWLRTGDLGLFDSQQNLHIKGRSKELIIHGGFNIYPPEVEAALNDHPGVIQSAVIGKSENGDELVCAFVEVAADNPPDTNELHAYIAQRLAPYKRPSLMVLTERLPATVTGKILKHRLLDDVIPLQQSTTTGLH
ncbi:MAG: AMP-binding protein [Pseudomonadota bacterium]